LTAHTQQLFARIALGDCCSKGGQIRVELKQLFSCDLLNGAFSLTSKVSKVTVMLSNGSGGVINQPQLTLNPVLGRLSPPSVMNEVLALNT
jgi:hypothetical protein